MPLVKLVSMFRSLQVESSIFLRPYIYDLFRDGLPSDGTCAARAVSGANKRSLTCVQAPALLKRVCAPLTSQPVSRTLPPVSPLHPVVCRLLEIFERITDTASVIMRVRRYR